MIGFGIITQAYHYIHMYGEPLRASVTQPCMYLSFDGDTCARVKSVV